MPDNQKKGPRTFNLQMTLPANVLQQWRTKIPDDFSAGQSLSDNLTEHCFELFTELLNRL